VPAWVEGAAGGVFLIGAAFITLDAARPRFTMLRHLVNIAFPGLFGTPAVRAALSGRRLDGMLCS